MDNFGVLALPEQKLGRLAEPNNGHPENTEEEDEGAHGIHEVPPAAVVVLGAVAGIFAREVCYR